MKRILYTLLGMLMFQANAQSTPYEIDKQATAKAQWKTGDNISTYLISLDEGFYDIDRQFQGITPQGFYLVQDFYQKEKKPFTQPFVLNHPQAFPLDWMEFMDIDPAPLVSDYQQYHLNGAKVVEIKSTGPNKHQRTSGIQTVSLKPRLIMFPEKWMGFLPFGMLMAIKSVRATCCTAFTMVAGSAGMKTDN